MPQSRQDPPPASRRAPASKGAVGQAPAARRRAPATPPPPAPSEAGEPATPEAAAPEPAAGARVWTTPRLSGFGGSFVLHVLLLLVLAMVVRRAAPPQRELALRAVQTWTPEELLIPRLPPMLLDSPAPEGALELGDPLPTLTPDAPEIPAPLEGLQAAPAADLADNALAPSAEALMERSGPTGGGLEGRSQQARARLAAARGGTTASENAVELGLQWLADHQRENGAWRFDLQGSCDGRCGNPGTVATTTGATALALLPFLGAGYTHTDGPHQETVQRGLYYLTSRMLKTPHGGDFQEGTMYAQGLAALALSEAYAMTGDENLKPFAQAAVDFICKAQHPGGGWRYFPGQPGDTTVTGWQLMALKSARRAGLEVPSPVMELVHLFLDSVQAADGALYGYQDPEKSPGPTAVGLYCRMLLGWRQEDPRLQRGVDFLATTRHSSSDMYFNYYAALVLNHHDGPQWPVFNQRLRDYLVSQQDKQGHQRGSWFFHDKHGDLAGRLYNTAVCIMTLEVYYRYMPLYEPE